MLRGALALEQRLPAAREGVDVAVAGRVIGLPQPQPGGVRFELEPDHASGILRLAWYGPAFVPEAGQRVEATVRLRRPHGLADPGAFDFERHALERGITATGYVRAGRASTPHGEGLDALRERFSHELERRLGRGSVANLLRALSVGDQAALTDADWDVLRATGTPHLVAISGFHVGVVAGLGALLARLLYFVVPALALRAPRQQAAALAALGAATEYSAVAGFSLPV
jgi:competence protein ComEC